MTGLVSLRPAQTQDEPFLFRVYASTRAEEMALVGWDAEQQQAFLQMQFNAQTQYYRMQYPNAESKIISRDDTPVGRLIVHRSNDEILLMDIALLPEYRNAGMGTTLIRALQSEAEKIHKPLHLHVEPFNPAMQLYKRLGFIKIDESGIYHLMEWRDGKNNS